MSVQKYIYIRKEKIKDFRTTLFGGNVVDNFKIKNL